MDQNAGRNFIRALWAMVIYWSETILIGTTSNLVFAMKDDGLFLRQRLVACYLLTSCHCQCPSRSPYNKFIKLNDCFCLTSWRSPFYLFDLLNVGQQPASKHGLLEKEKELFFIPSKVMLYFCEDSAFSSVVDVAIHTNTCVNETIKVFQITYQSRAHSLMRFLTQHDQILDRYSYHQHYHRHNFSSSFVFQCNGKRSKEASETRLLINSTLEGSWVKKKVLP